MISWNASGSKAARAFYFTVHFMLINKFLFLNNYTCFGEKYTEHICIFLLNAIYFSLFFISSEFWTDMVYHWFLRCVMFSEVLLQESDWNWWVWKGMPTNTFNGAFQVEFKIFTIEARDDLGIKLKLSNKMFKYWGLVVFSIICNT